MDAVVDAGRERCRGRFAWCRPRHHPGFPPWLSSRPGSWRAWARASFLLVLSPCSAETLDFGQWTAVQVHATHRMAGVGTTSSARWSAPTVCCGVVWCRHCSGAPATCSRSSTGQGACVCPRHCTTTRATLTTGLWSSSRSSGLRSTHSPALSDILE